MLHAFQCLWKAVRTEHWHANQPAHKNSIKMEIEHKWTKTNGNTIKFLEAMHLQPFFAPVANRIIFIASIFTSKAIKCVLIVLIFTYAVNVLPSDVRWNVLWCNFGRWPVKRSTFATFDPRLCSPSILSSIVLLSINIDDETKKKSKSILLFMSNENFDGILVFSIFMPFCYADGWIGATELLYISEIKSGIQHGKGN